MRPTSMLITALLAGQIAIAAYIPSSTQSNVLDTIEPDALEAAYRGAATRTIYALPTPILLHKKDVAAINPINGLPAPKAPRHKKKHHTSKKKHRTRPGGITIIPLTPTIINGHSTDVPYKPTSHGSRTHKRITRTVVKTVWVTRRAAQPYNPKDTTTASPPIAESATTTPFVVVTAPYTFPYPD